MLVREDSHRLSTAADGRVTLVESLDFECESCAAAYPAVKQILATYQKCITVVARCFPIPGHPNADLAARTAQAAANQGRFSEMYVQLFENQTSRSHKEQSQNEVFVGYARALGLDVPRFQRDLEPCDCHAGRQGQGRRRGGRRAGHADVLPQRPATDRPARPGRPRRRHRCRAGRMTATVDQHAEWVSPEQDFLSRATAWICVVGGGVGLLAAMILIVEKINLLADPDYAELQHQSDPVLRLGDDHT